MRAFRGFFDSAWAAAVGALIGLAMAGGMASSAPARAQPAAGAAPGASAAASSSAATAPKRVLFLSSFGYGRPGNYTDGFVSTLQAGGLSVEDVMVEYLDLNRSASADLRERRRELLLRQYGNQSIDLIVTFQQPALNFLLNDLKSLAPGAPVIASNATVPPAAASQGRRFLEQTVALDFKGTLELALRLFPATEHVLFLSGTGEQDLTSKREFQQAVAPWASRLRFEYTDHLSADEMLERVAHLPPRTVVIRSYTNRDKTGARFVPTELAAKITAVANAPVFALYDVTIGQGSIGGSVFHLQREAQHAAREALALLDGRRRLTEPVSSLAPNFIPMFDWQQLERWGADASVLPPDTVFVNRPPTLWGQYKGQVIGAAAVVVMLSGLSAALLAQNRRRRRAETEVRRLNAELEQRVHERTAQLEDSNAALMRARDEAEAADRAKRQFLANMSHEIRTPMNAIVGMTDLALRTELDTVQHGYLTRTRTAAHSLLGVINDILDFSKIEAGKLEMEVREFVLDEVLDKVTAVVGLPAQRKGLELLINTGTGVPRALVGDALRLQQVLINLCSNAVKFTDRGEIVVVTVKSVASEAQRVTLRFSVRDTGIGIAPDRLDALFRPFSQLDASTTRRHGGSGLGLAICRQLVELMDGEISVKSQLGKGSEFQFTAQFGLGRTPVPALAPSPSLRGLRILVVDDSANSLEIFQDLLAGLGYRPTLTSSAAAAIAELERALPEQPYDLLLLDWKMPDMDGFEAAARIAERLGARAPKIIVVTAYGDDEVTRRAAEAGMAACLAKPVGASTLMDAIATAMSVPRVPTSRRAPPPADAATLAALRGRRILLAEDNEMNQLVAVGLLQDVAGARVSVAHDGEQVVAMARTERHDLVLMDVQMPLVDGYEATRRIREHLSAAELPIIAMTAHAMRSDREKCLAAGMNDHVAKPFDPEALYEVLAHWLRQVPAHAPLALGEVSADGGPAPVISFERGLQRCLDRADLYERALRAFADMADGLQPGLRTAALQGPLREATRMAHSVVSAAGTIGAQGLSDTARALQQAIAAQAHERLPALLDAFDEQLQAVRAALRVHFESSALAATAAEAGDGLPRRS